MLISFSDDGLMLKAENLANLPRHHFLLQVPFAEIEQYEYFTSREFKPRDVSPVPIDVELHIFPRSQGRGGRAHADGPGRSPDGRPRLHSGLSSGLRGR